MILATILLFLGRNHYIIPPTKGSYTVDTIKIIAGGVKKKLCGDKSLVQNHWLDGAKVTKGGEFPDSKVEGVKCVIRLMPIFLTFIFYWTLYGQDSCRLRLNMAASDDQVQKSKLMEWSEEHDVLLLREMLARNVFATKKGVPLAHWLGKR